MKVIKRQTKQCPTCKGVGGEQAVKNGQYIVIPCRPCDGNGWIYTN